MNTQRSLPTRVPWVDLSQPLTPPTLSTRSINGIVGQRNHGKEAIILNCCRECWQDFKILFVRTQQLLQHKNLISYLFIPKDNKLVETIIGTKNNIKLKKKRTKTQLYDEQYFPWCFLFGYVDRLFALKSIFLSFEWHYVANKTRSLLLVNS